jgi:c-di-GMP-binding flagellar brake protein YcgR
MREKRRFIRIEEELKALIRPVDAEADAIFAALTRNVSGGGVALATDQPLKVGKALEVQLIFPERQQPLVFTAAVVWSDPLQVHGAIQKDKFESGLRFMEIDRADQEFIIQRANLKGG